MTKLKVETYSKSLCMVCLVTSN